jgi:phage shock protein PspC (stress-responsive transcriptional regulator)
MDATTTQSRPQAGVMAGTGSAFERNLKIAVIAMGVLIVLGVLTVIGRIIYLASRPAGQVTTLAASPRLALPAAASVRSVALSGDRLVVHYDAPTGSGISVLDLASGRVLTRVELVPEPPRQ